MRGLAIRWLVAALGLWLAAEVTPGMTIDDVPTLFAAALLLGLVNAVVRPVLVVLTFPVTLVTLGLFLLVVNAAMLGLVAALIEGFALAGLSSALIGSIIVSVTGWLGSWYVGATGRLDVWRGRRRD